MKIQEKRNKSFVVLVESWGARLLGRDDYDEC